MCVILFAWQNHPDYSLIVAANRDEFHRRRTRVLARWPDLPIIAGRDAQAGGTWLGVHADDPRRVAMVTNVRSGPPQPSGPRSRGELPVAFLAGDDSPADYAARVAAEAGDYQPVNLLVGDAVELWWVTNWPETVAQKVTPGIHGLSNGALDNGWPKVADGSAALAPIVAADRRDAGVEPYLVLLADDTRPDVDRLPDTGVPADFEKGLSSIFIDLPGYGTRASTVLRVTPDGRGDLTERRFTYRGRRRGTSSVVF
ncbi:NRDE family protein [Gordonia sp. ABSL1-1]|uniref:NRDE family protein n=1 Tax=Gordonia sp. ABSL1-1 TaxID=3053923 RepID=UPI002572FE53|nr:NRDE family protein [Gordonia sp. ABSL1-1]MDL9936317.1 NRDE family protein [Gordonia sp. ABSL1-1]